MHTQGIGTDGDEAAIVGDDALFAHDHQRLRDGRIDIVDHRTRVTSRHQRTIGSIASISEGLVGDAQSAAHAGTRQLAAGQADQDQLIVDITHGGRDGIGEFAIARRHVVERAMRFDMGETRASSGGKRRQRADLIQHQGMQLFGFDAHFAATESLQIRQ